MTEADLLKVGYRITLFSGAWTITYKGPHMSRYERVGSSGVIRPRMRLKKFRLRHPDKFAALKQQAIEMAADWVRKRLMQGMGDGEQ